MSTVAPVAGYAHREVTKPPNWHGLVAWDMLLNALTTGLFLTVAVGELVRPEVVGPHARWAYPAALVLLLVDLVCLVMDLGNKLRFHHMLRVFKPSSPMSLGTWALTAYSVPLTLLAAVEMFTILNVLPAEADSDAVWWGRRALLVLGLPVAFAAAGYKGVLFSTSSQPGWRDARWLGAYHLVTAVALGVGVLLAVGEMTPGTLVADPLPAAFAGLLVLHAVLFLLTFAELRPAFLRAYTRGQTHGLAAGVLFLATAVAPFGGLLLGSGPAAVVLLAAAALVARFALVGLPHALA